MRYGIYALRRLALLLPVLVGISIVSFLLVYMAPGNVATALLGDHSTPALVAAIEAKYHLNDSIPSQYWHWLLRVLHGDLGQSYVTHHPVGSLLIQRAKVTVEVAILSIAFAVVIAVPLGVWAATHNGKFSDYVALVMTYLAMSTPEFWIAILSIIIFAVQLGWLPAGGFTPLSDGLLANLGSVALPAFCLSLSNIALIARMLRSSMGEALSNDYIVTARAAGLPRRQYVWNDALRNSLIPTLTVAGIAFGQALAGTIIAETVFALPGSGALLIQSVFTRDVPVLQGGLLLAGLTYSLVNLAVDLLYGAIDPRIVYKARGGRH